MCLSTTFCETRCTYSINHFLIQQETPGAIQIVLPIGYITLLPARQDGATIRPSSQHSNLPADIAGFKSPITFLIFKLNG